MQTNQFYWFCIIYTSLILNCWPHAKKIKITTKWKVQLKNYFFSHLLPSIKESKNKKNSLTNAKNLLINSNKKVIEQTEHKKKRWTSEKKLRWRYFVFQMKTYLSFVNFSRRFDQFKNCYQTCTSCDTYAIVHTGYSWRFIIWSNSGALLLHMHNSQVITKSGTNQCRTWIHFYAMMWSLFLG